MAETYTWKETAASGQMAGSAGAGRTAEGASEPVTDYRAELAKMRSDVARLAEAVGGSLQTAIKPMSRELEATVARHPTMSVVVAAGVGLMLGILMSRS